MMTIRSSFFTEISHHSQIIHIIITHPRVHFFLREIDSLHRTGGGTATQFESVRKQDVGHAR